ncbi:hypothetical protein ACFV9C_43835 [Kribbella sp. NPDC059898]|uniref:hypothetical protein n=1 Tax=Kribbella sp. NPDC059898 TaxID=3346995 RepID=UPI003663FDE2
MTDTIDAREPEDVAARRTLLRDVLRLQDEHTQLEVEYLAVLATEDTDRVEDLNLQLLTTTARAEQLLADVDLAGR